MLGFRNPSETCLLKLEDIQIDNNLIVITEAKKQYCRRATTTETQYMTGKNCKSMKNWIDHIRPRYTSKHSDNSVFITITGHPFTKDYLRKYLTDNIQSHYHIVKGDIKKGFGQADIIVEGEYRTGFHEHIYIEPQAMAAIPREDGGLTVIGSLQCPYYVLKTLKAVLDCGEDKVNVVQTPMGGAFGGKEDYPSLLGAYVALLSLKSTRFTP